MSGLIIMTGSGEGGKGEKGKRGKGRGMGIVVPFFLFLFAFSPFNLFALSSFPAATQKKADVYVCPMHPGVKSSKPGKCPKCGMKLRLASDDTESKPDPKPSAESTPTKPEASVNLARIPDTTVYDQDGRKLRFYADLVKGKTVAINFVFTTCTTICPPLTATFRRVQQQLGERVGRDISLISISVDPTTDVPERLKSFAAKFNAAPGWTFLTGSKPEMDLLLAALGAKVANKNDHSPMILIGNEPSGNWTRTYGLAPPATLVKMITEAANKPASDSASIQVPLPGERTGSPATASSAQQSGSRQSGSRQSNSQPGGEAKQAKSSAEAAASYFTNTILMTQENSPVRFFDDLLKGKTVVINFMFTTCTGACPAMTGNLIKVQEYLGDRVGRDINMISISVDPAIDTPAALKAYATKFKAKPGWFFLTGEKENVNLILRKLGGYVEDKNTHLNLLYIGNVAKGEWMKAFAMSRPSELADAILKVADSK